MQMPIVREFRDDVLHKNPENQVRGEPFNTETPGVYTRVIVPRHSPFFITSLKMYFKNGQPMTEEHFRIYKIMPSLTALAAQGVACMIELIDPNIVEGFMDYDVIGEFTLFDTTMMNLMVTTTEDDRMIDWVNLKNKPIVFPPTLHPHSLLYDIMAFQDTIHLLDSISGYVEQLGTPLIEIKISRYFSNFSHYLALYKAEIMKFLNSHAGTYNEHGIKAIQVGLEKVDNFATAVNPVDLLGGRDDMHLTVQGLATIVNQTGFDSGEYLIKEALPISQYGNTNFIPPSIDGSFEGFGGVTETAGISLESDGSIVLLENRLDGRTRGLYYSVIENPFKAPKLTYSGFKYAHQKLAVDGVTVDRIAQGSGDECILVGDSARNMWYIGLTNGSMDPARHVYSRLNITPLLQAVYSNISGKTGLNLFPHVNVALMGSWIYIFVSADVGDPSAAPLMDRDLRYKHIFRVNVSDVQATVDVTPVRQYVTFVDADGVQWNNSPYFRWHDQVKDGNGNLLRSLFTFVQPLNTFAYLGLTCAQTLTAPDPNRPGMYALKFLGGYFASYFSASFNSSFNYTPELTYDFNPATGVMTLTARSNIPVINFGANPVIPPGYQQNDAMLRMTRRFVGQGLAVIANGVIVSSASLGSQGFPREAATMTPPGAISKYGTVSRHWGNATGWPVSGQLAEQFDSPLESGVNVRCVMYGPGTEYYVATRKSQHNLLQLYWKGISGGFALRSEASNLYVPNVYSRPLTSNVKKINAPFGLGGATVSVPGSQVGNYGIEIGQSAFCMGTQKKYFNREIEGTAWPGGVGWDDIIMMSTHTNRMDADGTVTLVPGVEIMYPAWIVEVLKAQVQYPAIKNSGRFCAVTICDPTFSALGNFGWLPITVGITYCDANGLPNSDTVYTTFMTISATYSAQGNRQVVTGVSVIDIYHSEQVSAAYQGSTPVVFGSNPATEGAQTNLGSMRTYYYLNGNALNVYFCTGIRSAQVFDLGMVDFNFNYANRNTFRWSSATPVSVSSLIGAMTVTPDNGLARIYPWGTTTGGAGSIIDGPAYKALVGSAYPEMGWSIYFRSAITAVFNGKQYVFPAGVIDLRDTDPSPANKTFYVYASLRIDTPVYEVTQEKRLESSFQVWVARVITNDRQILTIERFNVFTLNGSRISEIKRGNSIPASSGLVNVEGQLPWLRSDEMLPNT